MALSLALLASLVLGRLASRVGIPRVTAYVLVGLALGPHGLLRWFDAAGSAGRILLGPQSEAPLDALGSLAVGFILFGVGAEFRFETFRRVGARVLTVSGVEVGATALLVAAATSLATGEWRLALVAPVLAIASAPSATLVTLREVEAEGPATRCLVLCVGHNNLAALVLFPLLLGLAFGGLDPGGALGDAGLAFACGLALGLSAAVLLEVIDGRRELVLVGVLLVLATLGLVAWLRPGAVGLGMLGCLGAGVALANASPHSERLLRYVENTVYPLYVLFFIGAGRDLHVEALAAAGLFGALFVGGRTVGKLWGAHLGLRLAGFQEELPRWLGAGLLCQAGLALGLVTALEAATGPATAELRQVVVASVVIFELVGPWLVRRTVVAAGEVKLANLLPHTDASGGDALRWVWTEIRRNLGLPGRRAALGTGGLDVAHAMRRRPKTIVETLSFEGVLRALGETHADQLPVLDVEGRFEGLISYEEVKTALYDPVLRGLVIARDLTTPVEDALAPEDSLAVALERMDLHGAHSWPVVRDGQLLGMVRRSDAYALARSGLA